MPKAKNISEESRPPAIGDKVSFGTLDTVYEVTFVSADGNEVNVVLPGTKLSRFRVPVRDLNLVERREQATAPSPPPKLRYDAEEVKERLEITHNDVLEHLRNEIFILKKYLLNKGVPDQAIGQLDDLVESEEQRWRLTLSAIQSLLED
jgi:hypothetical protein